MLNTNTVSGCWSYTAHIPLLMDVQVLLCSSAVSSVPPRTLTSVHPPEEASNRNHGIMVASCGVAIYIIYVSPRLVSLQFIYLFISIWPLLYSESPSLLLLLLLLYHVV